MDPSCGLRDSGEGAVRKGFSSRSRRSEYSQDGAHASTELPGPVASGASRRARRVQQELNTRAFACPGALVNQLRPQPYLCASSSLLRVPPGLRTQRTCTAMRDLKSNAIACRCPQFNLCAGALGLTFARRIGALECGRRTQDRRNRVARHTLLAGSPLSQTLSAARQYMLTRSVELQWRD